MRLAIAIRIGRSASSGSNALARCTARAHQQHALACDVEPEVLANVANEPGAIRVVADDVFAVEFERIDSARLVALAVRCVAKLERVELERHRHVEPASAGLPKGLHVIGEAAGPAENRPVLDVFARARANIAWMRGDWLCATGLPMTA